MISDFYIFEISSNSLGLPKASIYQFLIYLWFHHLLHLSAYMNIIAAPLCEILWLEMNAWNLLSQERDLQLEYMTATLFLLIKSMAPWGRHIKISITIIHYIDKICKHSIPLSGSRLRPGSVSSLKKQQCPFTI